MRMIIFGLTAALTLVGTAKAQTLGSVELCVTKVAKAHGWSPEDLSKLQPQPVTIDGRAYEIRLGGTLSLACKEALADEAIAEVARMTAQNAQLAAERDQTNREKEALQASNTDLGIRLRQATGAAWYVQYPFTYIWPFAAAYFLFMWLSTLMFWACGRVIMGGWNAFWGGIGGVLRHLFAPRSRYREWAKPAYSH